MSLKRRCRGYCRILPCLVVILILSNSMQAEAQSPEVEVLVIKKPHNCKVMSKTEITKCDLSFRLRNVSEKAIYWDEYKWYTGMNNRPGSYNRRAWNPDVKWTFPYWCEIPPGQETSQFSAWGTGHHKNDPNHSIQWELKVECKPDK